MLALLYLGLAFYLGDQLCRRFFRFVSVAHRCAAAVLVGLLFSSWFTYLPRLALRPRHQAAPLGRPLLFAVVAIGAIWIFRRRSRRRWGRTRNSFDRACPGRPRGIG